MYSRRTAEGNSNGIKKISALIKIDLATSNMPLDGYEEELFVVA